MESKPGALFFNLKFSSLEKRDKKAEGIEKQSQKATKEKETDGNLSPYMLFPPVPLFRVKSPPKHSEERKKAVQIKRFER